VNAKIPGHMGELEIQVLAWNRYKIPHDDEMKPVNGIETSL